MLDVFKAVRESVTARQCAERYGFEFKRGRINCPFHGGKNFNLSFVGNGFNCFVCGVKGDSITFVKELYNLSPLESVKKINADFGLGLPIDEKAVKPVCKQDNRVKDFNEWENKACAIVSDYVKLLRQWRDKFAPQTPSEPSDARFIESLIEYDKWEYIYFDVFINGDYRTKAMFYRDYKERIDEIERKLNECRKIEIA